MSKGKKLLIVESPAKAKTIGKYLGADFVVKSSVGHIRDLPKEAGAIKITETGDGGWSFEPTYEVSADKKNVVSELKTAVKGASEIYLASDPDREGEAIAWHLREVLGPVAEDRPFRRVTYNEITKAAVLKAVAEPRDIDMPLVDAQQARRILDRLVGYKVSPLLWKSINCANNHTLSAGRVQSVALRLLVERQREIEAFHPETYYLMGVEAQKPGDAHTFAAKLVRFDGVKPDIRQQDVANNILLDVADAGLEVKNVKLQPKTRHALPPFTTSTLQQAASSMLGFSPGKTMKLAQSLYEQGRITYMRTDSVNISELARSEARNFIVSNYGEGYYPEKPNLFRSKADAQGAHEAVRPTDVGLTPNAAGASMDAQELKLYDLIWRRFMASQMADAKTVVKTIAIEAHKPGMAHAYEFSASVTMVEFDGFLKVMKLSLKKKQGDGEEDEDSDEVGYLPEVKVGDELVAVRWISDEKQTKGPKHYSEASLIKALEENGVGRPSTYAATIENLKLRSYAKSEKKKLIPLDRGIQVCDWLVKNMNSLFNVGYTAKMESELDKIEENGVPMNGMLTEFYRDFLASMPPPPKPPDADKFKLVLRLLSQVNEWKPSKKIGKHVYDDRKFFESCRKQFEAGKKEMSARQLEFLIRMAIMYSTQIPDCEAQLREGGLWIGAQNTEKADPELVKYCFAVMSRIEGMQGNPFLRSLQDQFDHGRALSKKQFQILARAVGENVGILEDADAIREKLSEFIPGEIGVSSADPSIAELFKLLNSVNEWRPKAKRGKKVYDDQSFVRSLSDQYSRRHTLSPRQLAALKRVVRVYRDKIPGYAEKAVALGLENGNESKSKQGDS